MTSSPEAGAWSPMLRGRRVSWQGLRSRSELVAGDLWRALGLRLAPARMRSIEADLRSRSTPAEYFHFASRHLGLEQIEQEVTAFLDFASRERPAVVCEIGTHHGGTNFLLGHALASVGTVIGIDIYVENRYLLGRLARPGTTRHYLNASSHTPLAERWLEKVLRGRAIDLCFIDGDHRYEGAKQDFLLYRKHVREGGLIAFHDIVWDHRARFGRETPRWSGDVPRLWECLKASYRHHEFVADPGQDAFGIGVIELAASVPLPPDL